MLNNPIKKKKKNCLLFNQTPMYHSSLAPVLFPDGIISAPIVRKPHAVAPDKTAVIGAGNAEVP